MAEGPQRTLGRATISLSGALSLLAIVAVLVVVSVPRLRGLALRENEGDARGTAQALARALAALNDAGRPPKLAELLGGGELRALGDVELLAGGRVLRRHGYLFEITSLPPEPAGAGAGQLAIRAWPWEHGATGSAAYLATQAGVRLVHANDGPSWEGLDSAGAVLPSLDGWRTGGG